MNNPGRTSKKKTNGPGHTRGRPGTDAEGRQNLKPETEPATEWGQRQDTGKSIARGGRDHGSVPGAEESR